MSSAAMFTEFSDYEDLEVKQVTREELERKRIDNAQARNLGQTG